MTNYGFARRTLKYDNRGNIIEQAYYDAEGNLYATNMGFAIVRTAYNQQGKKTEETFYGTDDKPCIGATGYACATFNYDPKGNPSEVNYFKYLNNKMDPTLNICLVSKEVYEYDDSNNCIGIKYYDVKGRPALWNNQYTSVENEYDGRHLLIQSKFYDLMHNCTCKTQNVFNQYSCPFMQYIYDGNDNLIRETIQTLMVTHDLANQNTENTFIILEWENWNITDHLNQYVNMLIQSRLGQSKRLVVINEWNEPELIYVDSDAIITNTGLTEEQYEYARDIYENEWLNDWRRNYN